MLEISDTSNRKIIPQNALSRGIAISELYEWMNGPLFLRSPDITDDSSDDVAVNDQKADAEIKCELKESEETNEICNFVKVVENELFQQLLQKCSSFLKIQRTLAYVLRFIRILRNKVKETVSISVNELKASENLLFQWCQREINVGELSIQKLKPKSEDDLLRAHGRLENIRSLPQQMCKSIILPRNHPLVILLLRHLHEKNVIVDKKSCT